MSIYHMTKAKLIAKIERDDASVRRAAAVLKDNAELQQKVADLRSELAKEKAKPPRQVVNDRFHTVVKEVVKEVKVPGSVRTVVKTEPCPEQVREIEQLKAKIADLEAGPKVAEFRHWQKMRKVAQGARE